MIEGDGVDEFSIVSPLANSFYRESPHLNFFIFVPGLWMGAGGLIDSYQGAGIVEDGWVGPDLTNDPGIDTGISGFFSELTGGGLDGILSFVHDPTGKLPNQLFDTKSKLPNQDDFMIWGQSTNVCPVCCIEDEKIGFYFPAWMPESMLHHVKNPAACKN